ncbi:uncharacterized protein [Medicago truncatula]|uniref:uncharacterized protein n=1 Tax=Medicago truncatula TaxID=3880 RepID=UPI000D2F1C14|nr:uncharacterized protein LOC25494952 [Medicago truncatula]
MQRYQICCLESQWYRNWILQLKLNFASTPSFPNSITFHSSFMVSTKFNFPNLLPRSVFNHHFHSNPLALVLGFVVSQQIAMAGAGQLNMIDSPSRGSRSVDCFERLEKSAKAPIVMFTWPKRSKPVKLSLSRKYVWIMGEGV